MLYYEYLPLSDEESEIINKISDRINWLVVSRDLYRLICRSKKILELPLIFPTRYIRFKNQLPEALYASPTVILFLDLFLTMAFAVTVAFKAIEHKSDIVGIIIVSTITGVAGGIIREMILGRIPPNALVNPLYIIVTVTVAIIIFFLHPSLKKVLEFIAEIRNDLVVDVFKKFSNNLS
jgi:hypothetical protein